MRRFLTASSALALCLATGMAVAQTPPTPSPNPRAPAPMTGGSSTQTPSAQMPSTQTPGPTGGAAMQGQPGPSGEAKLSEPEITFMKKAEAANITEIDTSKVALTKATRPDIKQFAQQMVDDHTKLSNEMKQLADSKGVQLPQRDPAAEAATHKLDGLSGARFDQEYVRIQVAGHRDASKLYHTEESQVRDPQLKQAVAQATPIIDQHLTHAEQLASEVGLESRTSSLKK
jgi:putative membrane protein